MNHIDIYRNVYCQKLIAENGKRNTKKAVEVNKINKRDSGSLAYLHISGSMHWQTARRGGEGEGDEQTKQYGTANRPTDYAVKNSSDGSVSRGKGSAGRAAKVRQKMPIHLCHKAQLCMSVCVCVNVCMCVCPTIDLSVCGNIVICSNFHLFIACVKFSISFSAHFLEVLPGLPTVIKTVQKFYERIKT